MNFKVILSAMALAATTACALVPQPIFAEPVPPVQDIDPVRHGNLAAAQGLVGGAYNKLTAAQEANHGALGGHAARAKELLRQANDELKWAAETDDRRR